MLKIKTWIRLVWLVGILLSIPSTVFGVSEHEEGTPTEESSTEIREVVRQKIVEAKPPISALVQISKGLADTEMSKEAFTKLVDRTQGLEKKQRDAIIGSFQEASTRLGSSGKKKLRDEFSQAVNGALADLEKSLTEPPAKSQPEAKTAEGKPGQGNPLDPKAQGPQGDLAKVLEKLLQQAEDPSLRGKEAQRELLRSLLAQNAAKNEKGEGGGGAPGGGNGKAGGPPGGDPQGGPNKNNNGADKIAKAIKDAGHDEKKDQPEKRSSSNANDNNNSDKKNSSEESRNRNSDGNSSSSREALASLMDDKKDETKEEPKAKKEKPDMDKLLGLGDKSKQEDAPEKSVPSFLLGGKEPLSPASPNQSLAFNPPDQGGGGGGGGGSSDLAGAKTASAQGPGPAVSGDPPPLQEPSYGPQVAAGTVFERNGIYQNAGSSGGGGSLDDDGDDNGADATIPEKLKALGPAPRTVVVRENNRSRGRDRAAVRRGNILEQNKGNLIVDMCAINPGNPFCWGRVTPFDDRMPGSKSQLGGLPS